MAEVQRINQVIAKLRVRAATARRDADASVAVGYTAPYALFVHENMEREKGTIRQRHERRQQGPMSSGQAKLMGQPRPSGKGVYWGPSLYGPKFLEGPAREFAAELGVIVRKALQAGKTMAQGLLLAGLRLQRESQLRVPVEYGNLRASAFTRLE